MRRPTSRMVAFGRLTDLQLQAISEQMERWMEGPAVVLFRAVGERLPTRRTTIEVASEGAVVYLLATVVALADAQIERTDERIAIAQGHWNEALRRGVLEDLHEEPEQLLVSADPRRAPAYLEPMERLAEAFRSELRAALAAQGVR